MQVSNCLDLFDLRCNRPRRCHISTSCENDTDLELTEAPLSTVIAMRQFSPYSIAIIAYSTAVPNPDPTVVFLTTFNNIRQYQHQPLDNHIPEAAGTIDVDEIS